MYIRTTQMNKNRFIEYTHVLMYYNIKIKEMAVNNK